MLKVYQAFYMQLLQGHSQPQMKMRQRLKKTMKLKKKINHLLPWVIFSDNLFEYDSVSNFTNQHQYNMNKKTLADNQDPYPSNNGKKSEK